jgi:hypothetical protein
VAEKSEMLRKYEFKVLPLPHGEKCLLLLSPLSLRNKGSTAWCGPQRVGKKHLRDTGCFGFQSAEVLSRNLGTLTLL